MKLRVYIDTTVISYLTARPAHDVFVAGHQQSTRDWWDTASNRCELVISELFRQECRVRRSRHSTCRLSILASLATLHATAEADGLAESSFVRRPVRDAVRIAIAAANGVQYLVPRNFATSKTRARPLIESACRLAGFEPPTMHS